MTDKNVKFTWVVQLVKHLTLDFGSDHHLMVCGIEPCVGLCADSMEFAWVSLAPSPSAPPLLVVSLSLSLCLTLKINKYFFKK